MRFAIWPNLTQPWAGALALGWDGVYIAEIAGADQKLLGGVAEFTPRTTSPKGSHARAVGPNDGAARATLTSLLSHSPTTRAKSC
jgi:hypothetical protein